MIAAAIPWLVILAILGVVVMAFPVVSVLAVASALGAAVAGRRRKGGQ